MKHSLRPKVSATEPHDVAAAELDPPEPGLDPTLPVSPVDGPPGHQVKEPANDDEDGEGRSTTEQLAEQGVEDAAKDTADQAAHAGSKHSRSEL
ncbi:MAG: hypothetical protein NTV51_01970 [Verrucomicrobia bacterium]|nr:hypothetical protein [Verrucomicrobiota bacterium]